MAGPATTARGLATRAIRIAKSFLRPGAGDERQAQDVATGNRQHADACDTRDTEEWPHRERQSLVEGPRKNAPTRVRGRELARRAIRDRAEALLGLGNAGILLGSSPDFQRASGSLLRLLRIQKQLRPTVASMRQNADNRVGDNTFCDDRPANHVRVRPESGTPEVEAYEDLSETPPTQLRRVR